MKFTNITLSFDKCRKLWLRVFCFNYVDNFPYSTLSLFNNKWITSCVIYLFVLCFETEGLTLLYCFSWLYQGEYTLKDGQSSLEASEFHTPKRGQWKYFSPSLRNQTSFCLKLATCLIPTHQKPCMPESELYRWPSLTFWQERSHIQSLKKQEAQTAVQSHSRSGWVAFSLGKLEDYSGTMC